MGTDDAYQDVIEAFEVRAANEIGVSVEEFRRPGPLAIATELDRQRQTPVAAKRVARREHLAPAFGRLVSLMRAQE